MGLINFKCANDYITMNEIIGVLQMLPDYINNSKDKDYIQTAATAVSDFLASKGVDVETKCKTRHQAMDIY
jgi:hypothetical protein